MLVIVRYFFHGSITATDEGFSDTKQINVEQYTVTKLSLKGFVQRNFLF